MTTTAHPPVTCVVSPRVPSLVARLAQLVATFGNGRNDPEKYIPGIPAGPTMFLNISGHVGTVEVRYFSAGWISTKEDGEDTGETWCRNANLIGPSAEDDLEALVREVEDVCGIAPSFAMFPPVNTPGDDAIAG